MIIHNLILKNFRIISDEEFTFQKGFNVFSGDIGQGKSQAFQAIAHSLIDDKRKKLEQFIQWGKDSYQCDMEFMHNSINFKSFIAYDKSKGSERKLVVNDNEQFQGSDVKNKLAEYFDPPLVRASAISYQGSADVIEATESVRRENLKRIYDLDFTDKIKILDAEADDIKRQLAEVDEKIVILKNKEYDFKPLERLLLSQDKLHSLESRYNELQVMIDSIEKEKERYQQKLSDITSVQETINQEQRRLTTKQSRKSSIQSELDTLSTKIETADYYFKVHELKQILVESNVDELTKEKDSITLPIVKEINLEHKNDLLEQRSNVSSELHYHKTALQSCKDGLCPTCGKEFDSGDEEKHTKQIEIVEAQLTLIDEELMQFAKTEERRNKQIEELKDAEHKIILYEEKIKSEKERVTREREQLNEKIKLENNYAIQAKENDAKRLEELQVSIHEIEIESKEIQQRIDADKVKCISLQNNLGDEPAVNDEVILEKDTTKSQIDRYYAIVERNKLNEQYNEQLKEQQEKDNDNLIILREERDNISNNLEATQTGKEIIKKLFPNYVISQTVKDIEQRMNDFLTKTYDRYPVKLLDGKNGLSIQYGPSNEDVSEASGGERDIYNLALKIAFSRMSGLRILMLDEVDKFHSLEIAKKEFAIIKDMLDDGYIEQVFIITHKDEIKQVLENDYMAKVFELENGNVI